MAFQPTRWSLVRRAGERDERGREALAELLAAYWQPVYVYFRRAGADRDEAEDLTQGLFALLCERGDLATVDARRGRFRSWLCVCARHHLVNERARANADKRGGGRVRLAVDIAATEAWLVGASTDTESAEAVFERRWAETVLERALQSLTEQEHRAGRGRAFEVLRAVLDGGPPPGPWAELATALETGEGALRVAAHRLKERFHECLVAEVRETLGDDHEPGAELRELLGALGRPGVSPSRGDSR